MSIDFAEGVLNLYKHDDCGSHWADLWNCGCNDFGRTSWNLKTVPCQFSRHSINPRCDFSGYFCLSLTCWAERQRTTVYP
jgi:hypothetical protein